MKTNKILQFIILALFLGAVFPLRAQISIDSKPKSFEINTHSEIEKISFPEIDLESILIEDSLDALRNRPMRFGYAHDSQIDFFRQSTKFQDKEGNDVYLLEIICQEAKSINLIYERFQLAKGAEFFVYTPDRQNILGAFTSANHKDNGGFATGLTPGDRVYLEYNANGSSESPEILINSVIHGYRSMHFPDKDFGDSGPCNLNVNCPVSQGWQDQINSVAMIVVGNGTRWCSGAMINNTCEDGSPYFLTANHCLTGNFANWMFYFNYQSPSCNNVDGPTNQIVTGAELLSTNSASDFALFEMSSRPPVNYNAYYSGWSRLGTGLDSTVGVHHPSGDIKKISFDNDPVTSTFYLSNAQIPNADHWRVVSWDSGTTEGGSSGSPLYNMKGQIIGQLHGGYASCNNLNASDWYGKMSSSWDNGMDEDSRLDVWLDPAQSNKDSIYGSYFNTIASTDAAIDKIINPVSRTCLFSQIPSIRVKNKGLNDITSLKILWSDGLQTDTINWLGNISTGSSEEIVLDTISFTPGNYILNAELIEINGIMDNNSCNNSFSKSVDIVNGSEIELKLRTDNWPEETSVWVSDTLGNIIYRVQDFRANRLDTFYFCLPPGCYNVRINDSWGDGIIGTGFYHILYQDSLLYLGSGAFGNCTGSQMAGGCFVEHRVCIDSATFTQGPIANFQYSDTLLSIGDTLFLEDISTNFPTNINWTLTSPDTTALLGGKNAIFIPKHLGVYDIDLIVSNFFGSDSTSISNAFRVQPSSLNAGRFNEYFSLFPNPANDRITLSTEINSEKELRIFNLNGSELLFEKSSNQTTDLDISELNKGLYIIEVQTKKGIYRSKFMVQ